MSQINPENPQPGAHTPLQERPPTPPREERGRDRREKRDRGNPVKSGRDRVEEKAKQVLLEKFRATTESQVPVGEMDDYRREVRRELQPQLKEEIDTMTGYAKDIRNEIELKKTITEDNIDAARDLTESISAFIKAAEMGFIKLPVDHDPTQAILEGLADKLRENLKERNAAYFQPLIRGLLNEAEYIKFSQPGEAPTKLEQDLKEMLPAGGANDAEYVLTDIFTTAIQKGKIPGITIDQFNTKLKESKNQRKVDVDNFAKQLAHERREAQKLLRGRERRGGDPDDYVVEKLQSDISQGVEEAADALRLFESLEKASDFYGFYQGEFNKILHARLVAQGKLRVEESLPPLADLHHTSYGEADIERAAKDTTDRIHKLLLYTTHLVFTPILEGDPGKNWQELVREASGTFGINPDNVFNNFRNKFTFLVGQTQTLPGEIEGQGIPFFNFGLEERDVYLPGEDGELQNGKVVRKEVVSPELKHMHTFKEFLEGMHVALDTEHNLLQAGINFNFLLMTGKTNNKATFFQQAAEYAHHTLESHRIDELYHLPYHELVHAAKIQLSSHFKKQFAMNDWIKDPRLFYAAFDHSNKVQREALHGLIRSFAKEDTPEWAIRRAFFHARMHLSLISQEWHSYAGYGHANLTEDFQPTYTDPALKNLETYRTWWFGEQWQVPDTFVQNMAFLPSPNRTWRHNTWFHKDVTDEGENVYRQMSHVGKMALLGRDYFDLETAPNIMEFNPLLAGGVEQQGSWRFKYPSAPWLFDMLNHLGRNNESIAADTDDAKPEAISANAHHNLEYGWKRLENLGVDVMKMYRDAWLMDGSFLELDGDKTKYEKEWKNFFSFLYERYFKEGVGKNSFSVSFHDENLKDHNIKFSEINSPDEFWNRVVAPILHRRSTDKMVAEGEEKKDAEERNDRERVATLKEIVTHAMTVMAYERLPMDFVFMENPTRSQNGVTLLKELQSEFINTSPFGEGGDERKNEAELKAFKAAIDDILYVQERARADSIAQMNDFVKNQQDKVRDGNINDLQRTIYGETLASMKQIHSDVQLLKDYNPDFKGYRINEEVVRWYVTEKYKRDPDFKNKIGPNGEMSDEVRQQIEAKVDQAVRLYTLTTEKIMQKPAENHLIASMEGLSKWVDDTRIKRHMHYEGLDSTDKQIFATYKEKFMNNLLAKYKKAREETITTRAMWSEHELLSGELGIGLNDVAYPFLTFSSVGPHMVSRTIEQIKDTQEVYFNYVANGDLLSDLKKYYRKEDKDSFFEHVSEVRSTLKNWLGPDMYDGTAMKLVENAMNILRINSDAENNMVELAYITDHRPRSAFSKVVKEGDEFPLHREDRYGFISEFLHYSNFHKRAEGEFQHVEKMSYEDVMAKKGWLGQQIAKIAEQFFGKEEGKLVRVKWKELSGEGLRSREFASLVDIFIKFGGPTYLSLLAAAMMILLVSQGYKEAEES